MAMKTTNGEKMNNTQAMEWLVANLSTYGLNKLVEYVGGFACETRQCTIHGMLDFYSNMPKVPANDAYRTALRQLIKKYMAGSRPTVEEQKFYDVFVEVAATEEGSPSGVGLDDLYHVFIGQRADNTLGHNEEWGDDGNEVNESDED